MREYYYRDLELLEKFITSGKKTLIITSDNLDEVKKIKSHRYGCVVLENAVGDIEDIQKFLNKMRKIGKFLYWIPRIFSILFILFLSVREINEHLHLAPKAIQP